MMLSAIASARFDDADLLDWLSRNDDSEIDALEFGVIGFDAQGIVRRYSAVESAAAGLARERVVGFHLFKSVASCMDNALVAHRFDDAAARGVTLDVTVPYVLTLRMRPTRVSLRLLQSPREDLRYVLIDRRA